MIGLEECSHDAPFVEFTADVVGGCMGRTCDAVVATVGYTVVGYDCRLHSRLGLHLSS